MPRVSNKNYYNAYKASKNLVIYSYCSFIFFPLDRLLLFGWKVAHLDPAVTISQDYYGHHLLPFPPLLMIQQYESWQFCLFVVAVLGLHPLPLEVYRFALVVDTVEAAADIRLRRLAGGVVRTSVMIRGGAKKKRSQT